MNPDYDNSPSTNANAEPGDTANRGKPDNPGSTSPESELSQLAAERDRYLEIAQRTRAELENYQKRVAREMQTERRYAVGPLVTELLPALDNMERALASAAGKSDSTGIVAGVEMVYRQLLAGLSKHGVETLEPTGSPFDPNHHEALMQQPSNEHPPMTVLQTVQKGYLLHDRLLRPAHVVVSTPASGQTATASNPGDHHANV